MLGNTAEVKFSVIEHSSLEGDVKVTRKITSIFGMPFYQSSGLNSDFPDTWFPFHGLNEQGVFIKRSSEDFAFPLPTEFHQIFAPLSCYDKRAEELYARFGTLGGVLISSCLGGGLWESKKGKELLNVLKKKYAAFYEAWPLLVLEDSEFMHVDEIHHINQWLLSKMDGNNMKALWLIFPKSFDALINLPTQPKGETKNDAFKEPDRKKCIIC